MDPNHTTMKYTLLIAFLFSSFLQAQNAGYNPEIQHDPLFKFASFVNVGNQTYHVEDIHKNKNLIYKPLLSENHSLGFTTDNFWVRFKLINTQLTERFYYLETARPVTDIANLYQISVN